MVLPDTRDGCRDLLRSIKPGESVEVLTAIGLYPLAKAVAPGLMPRYHLGPVTWMEQDTAIDLMLWLRSSVSH